MKRYAIHQEILLMANTGFFSRQQWCKKTDPDNGDNNLSERDRLEEACWNGEISGMLPELLQSNHDGEDILLWEIHQGNCFLDLELGQYPISYEKEFSINPYVFMEAQLLN